MTARSAVGLALVLGLAASCEEGGGGGEGTLAVEIWGEDFIETGIPSAVFSDGWSVTFGRFLVAVDAIGAARGEAAADLTDDEQRVFDLVRPGPTPILTRVVPAGRFDSTTYRIGPAQPAAAAGNASAADLDRMRTGGWSVWVEGTATHGAEAKTFAWGFTTATTYHHCRSEADLHEGAAATVQLTIHGDHLFYDDLFSSDPDVTFEVLAQADADGDDEVTEDELAAFDIRALPDYGTGSTGIDNLLDFVAHLTGTLGHIDGEGHCETR